MKKKIFLIVTIILIMALTITGCSNNTTESENDEQSQSSHEHSYTLKEREVEGALVKAPSCIQKGEYYFVCSCGKVGTETYETDFSEHIYDLKIEDEKHFASNASCFSPKKYYYSCSVCGDISDMTFESGECLSHEYKDNICIYDCGDELNKYSLSNDGKYYILEEFNEDVEIAFIPSSYKGLPVKSIGEFAFSSVKEVVLPETIVNIESYAFYGNADIEKINLESVVSIGENAFAYCEKIKEVNLSSVESLGSQCFSYTGLTEITIPEGVTSIGFGAFSYCDSLTMVNYLASDCEDLCYPESAFYNYNETVEYFSLFIGEGVERIPSSLFANSHIKEIDFSNVEICNEIGERAFNGVVGLDEITIDKVETIGSYAFHSSSITKLTLGGEIVTVGEYAFASCENLTEAIINVNRGGYGEYLFANSSNLKNVYYNHNGEETIGRAFASSGDINLIFGKNVKKIPANFEKGDIKTIAFEEESADVTIGENAFISAIEGEIDLSSVVSIGSNAFYRSNADKVILSKTLNNIGTYVFGEVLELIYLSEECDDIDAEVSMGAFKNVYSVTIGKEVKRIPANIFKYSTIDTVNFEAGSICSSIGSNAFYYASISNLYLSNTIEIIEEGAFEHIQNVTNTINLNFVKRFDKCAFRYYKGEITLNEPVASVIGEASFLDSNVSGILDLSNVTDIGSQAFYNCSGITKVIFGEELITIGSGAFVLCTEITEIEFNAANVSDLESSIFSNHNGEMEFTLIIGNKVTYIPKNMFRSSKVKSVTFEANSKCITLGEYSFSYTYNLTDIVLPDSVETIKDNAFVLTQMESITFGKGIKYIGQNALKAMGETGNEESGAIKAVYFTTDATFVVSNIETTTNEEIAILANSDENALEYAEIFYRTGYTYTLKEENQE